MGLTTERIIARMAKTKKWTWTAKTLPDWFVIEGRVAYFNTETGAFVCKDAEFLRELETAFGDALAVELKRQ
jgi:hypothetical protein